jgi:hypothetical protein
MNYDPIKEMEREARLLVPVGWRQVLCSDRFLVFVAVLVAVPVLGGIFWLVAR